MSFYYIVSVNEHFSKLDKLWEYEYDKVLFFGSGNASGRLRFTTHHNPNDSKVI